MIERLYSAVKRRRRGLAITSESGTGRRGPGAEDEVLVLFLLIKVRFLSPPYSNCPGSTCLTHLGTEGVSKAYRAVEKHTTQRLRHWLCAKHKVQGQGTKRFSDDV